jgi:sugar phosphate isomerase/epimerase
VRFVYETIQFSPFLCDGQVPLARQFEAAAAAGFDGVGIDVWSVERHVERGGTIEQLVTALERAGTTCLEVQALGLDGGEGLLSPAHVVGLVEAFRPEVVMAGCSPEPDAPTAAAARDAVDRIAALGARVAVEFLPMLPLDTIAKARDVVGRVGGRVGVCVDTWHFFHGPDGWDALEQLPPAELAYIQLNDALPAATGDVWHETLHRRALPGQGELDLARFHDVVEAKGYGGPVAVEVMSAALRELTPEAFARQAVAAARACWP